LLGALPDDEYRTPIDSIEFLDPSKPDGVCDIAENGRKIINIEFGTKEYQLTYQINPSNATDQDVVFYINCDEDVATISKTGLITFYKEISVTVRIYNKADIKEDYVIIQFDGQIEEEITENPFG
jgi:hypothetical protein